MLGEIIRGQRNFFGLALAYVEIGIAAKLAGLPVTVVMYSSMTLAALFVLGCGLLLWRISVVVGI